LGTFSVKSKFFPQRIKPQTTGLSACGYDPLQDIHSDKEALLFAAAFRYL
jgi:hypothetical protein